MLCLDAATGQSVYRQMLPFHPRITYVTQPGCSASPAYTGNGIYLFDNSGNAIVIAPGRRFQILGQSVLENILSPGEWGEQQEQLISSPFFDTDSIYLRGPQSVYCIREVTPAK